MFDGPFQVHNLYPLFLHADEPYLETAGTENSASFSLSHSSTYTVEDSREWMVHLDMEITEFAFRYKRIIRDLMEFDLDIPVLIIGGGFLDGPLESYHDAFNFADYGRSNRPHNELLYEVSRNGNPVIRGNSGTRFGDIRIALKKPLISSDDYVLSLKGDVELPVSNAKKGYSNGSVDAGISLLFDKHFSENTMTYWNAGAVFPGDLRGYERVNLRNYLFGGLAVESMFGEHLSLLVQLYGQSEIYPDTEIAAVDGRAYLITFGGRYYGEKKSVELSLTEDLNTTGAPDFIFNFTYHLSL